MAVKTLRLRNLSAFEDVTFKLSPGINVLLGANSTGKTHVLKWLYATLKVFEKERKKKVFDPVLHLMDLLSNKFLRVFLPASGEVGDLVRRAAGASSGELRVEGQGEVLGIEIDAGGGFGFEPNRWTPRTVVTYIPSREMLAHYEGFVSEYLKRESQFDETFFDLCVSLGETPLRSVVNDFAYKVSSTITDVVGGAVELDGGRFYVNFERSGGPRLEAQLVAEGLRKLASVARLVRTGAIAEGSLLLWDEPESGMNPRLVAAVARILGILVREGVQVVIATHDFLLAQRISLLAEAKDPIPARFFLLSREGEGKPVQVVSGGTLTDLPRTPMEDEYLRLYDDQRAAFAED